MVICKDFKDIKIEAIKILVEEDTKSVTIFFDKNKEKWCVDWEVLDEEEWNRI